MKRLLIIFSILILGGWSRESAAFWGSDSDSTGTASGLDVASGFDVNTITTVNGTVISPPERKGQEQHTAMTILSNQGTVTTVVGPWWYWEKNGIGLAKGSEVSVTGSLAQGKDGGLYLFAQKIENRSTGEAVTLRSDSGKPAWSGSGGGNGQRNSTRQGGGYRGGGYRGGRR